MPSSSTERLLDGMRKEIQLELRRQEAYRREGRNASPNLPTINKLRKWSKTLDRLLDLDTGAT